MFFSGAIELTLVASSSHSNSVFGHDKSLEIRPYAALAERPVMFYAGDGVSDLSAAKETDLLFAKAGQGTFAWVFPGSGVHVTGEQSSP